MRASMVVAMLLCGCESGLSEIVELTVPGSVTAPLSESVRRVVVMSDGAERLPFVVLCGQGLPSPLVIDNDLGLGCLGSKKGTSVSFTVWVQPLPLDARELGCSPSRSFYQPLASGALPDGGSLYPEKPESSWASGSAVAEWKPDGSPCGGIAKTKITLAVP